MEVDPHSSEFKGLALWAHEKCGHLGEKATYRWAQDQSISLTMDLIKSVILQCPICQHVKHRSLPQLVKGQLARGKLPGQIWQIDYTGPLICDKGCQYVCTAVDTYSGYLVAIPCGKANQTNTIKTLEIINLYYGVPLQIQSDNG